MFLAALILLLWSLTDSNRGIIENLLKYCGEQGFCLSSYPTIADVVPPDTNEACALARCGSKIIVPMTA